MFIQYIYMYVPKPNWFTIFYFDGWMGRTILWWHMMAKYLWVVVIDTYLHIYIYLHVYISVWSGSFQVIFFTGWCTWSFLTLWLTGWCIWSWLTIWLTGWLTGHWPDINNLWTFLSTTLPRKNVKIVKNTICTT